MLISRPEFGFHVSTGRKVDAYVNICFRVKIFDSFCISELLKSQKEAKIASLKVTRRNVTVIKQVS